MTLHPSPERPHTPPLPHSSLSPSHKVHQISPVFVGLQHQPSSVKCIKWDSEHTTGWHQRNFQHSYFNVRVMYFHFTEAIKPENYACAWTQHWKWDCVCCSWRSRVLCCLSPSHVVVTGWEDEDVLIVRYTEEPPRKIRKVTDEGVCMRTGPSPGKSWKIIIKKNRF